VAEAEAAGAFHERPEDDGTKLGAPPVKASGGMSNFDRLTFGSALILSQLLTTAHFLFA
jgi:hypothetical protein